MFPQPSYIPATPHEHTKLMQASHSSFHLPLLQEEVMDRACGGGGEYLGRKKGKNNKRRFSDEQIRLLETMFEEETKLEPRKKLQLARELGLQPRQVAIWFQNRRARWKTKKLEREYNVLKADYDALAESFESLKKERQSLLKQVQKLTELVEKPEKGSERRRAHGEDSDNGVAVKCEEGEEKPKLLMGEEADLGLNVCSDGENSINCMESFGPEESDLVPIVEPAANGWPEEWGDLDSGSFSDQSSCTMEWWDFWA